MLAPDFSFFKCNIQTVVDLPDILLPEEQYVDMFDSESDISGDNSEDELVEVL